MKSLKTLIRLHKQQLDALRQELGQWQDRRQRFVQASETLAGQLRHELQVASDYPEMTNFFGQFSKHIEEQQENIKQQIMRVDRQIGILQEQILQAFGEVKKYEIALEVQREEKRQREERLEQAMLDEIGSQRHLREAEE